MNALPPEELRRTAARLDRLRGVPDDVLADAVMRDGLCVWVFSEGDAPDLTGDDDADRELARRLCEGCPVADHCLELELRATGERTAGVFGGLPEQDRQALFPHWRSRRAHDDEHQDGEEPTCP
ncbi:WhiB family transcriptional regulator [Streptoalloteichus tenebrarius]|uniref:WhiB family transcriptional regulator n=1 Tax=Streptoalloteichus tenebrarius (strain ATCC 17920 / DSM 40477 / JCM 4838 / CBS 697.72 / NBRC 16177 / NCIMB 11028 / NRRL B-12390 / A12253. 1 / ISP 5477) TaxID=1933 RepID=UPI0020A4EE0C|nr:WhiB family transcriptional regulator [Streptoalloteichus tenebrarius]